MDLWESSEHEAKKCLKMWETRKNLRIIFFKNYTPSVVGLCKEQQPGLGCSTMICRWKTGKDRSTEAMDTLYRYKTIKEW